MKKILAALLLVLVWSQSHAATIDRSLMRISDHTVNVFITDFGMMYITDLRGKCREQERVALIGPDRIESCYPSILHNDYNSPPGFKVRLMNGNYQLFQIYKVIRNSGFKNFRFDIDEKLETDYKKDPNKVIQSL